MSVADNLAAHDLTLPQPAAPAGDYVPALRTGSYVYTSGQIAMRDGSLVAEGKVGAEVDECAAADCARQCALNVLAAASTAVDLDDVVRVLKVVVFVASDPSFTAQPQVANAASAVFAAAFGDAGVHTRSAVGVAALPLGTPVEIEAVLEVR